MHPEMYELLPVLYLGIYYYCYYWDMNARQQYSYKEAKRNLNLNVTNYYHRFYTQYFVNASYTFKHTIRRGL